ncbi:MAG: hypothetical protein JWO12_2045 [Frankiales bacterium]|nr:hypothetical protein [Frankiales bacterium]
MTPLLQLVLPGQWAQTSLTDEVRVARVLELLSANGSADERVRSRVRELAAAGGDQLYLELGSADPTMVLTAWSSPGAEDPTGEGVAHRYGYRVLRTTGPGRASYSVMHPASRRVLSLTVIGAPEPAVWDELVGTVTWEELSPPARAASAPP